MTHEQSLPGTFEPHDASLTRATAGAMLRDAREAAGLSLDVVSAQLKLAPRQVKALEDDDFGLLPGRTFVRGFARNYARLVRLDPDTVLQALPGGATAGGLEAPPLHATTGTMGELPSTSGARPAWLRWVVPVLILIVLAAAGGYQYLREARKAPAHAGAPPAPREPATGLPAPATTALPNPVVATPLDSGPAIGNGDAGTGAGGATSAGEVTGIAPISLSLRGSSWVEIRDSTGRVVLQQTLDAGQTQSVVGTPPFDVAIGNAAEVTLTFRGRPVDLAPYTRQNIARLTLQ